MYVHVICIHISQCYSSNNVGLSGGVSDYPLCSIELYADMDAAIDTPTCFRRGMLYMKLLNRRQECNCRQLFCLIGPRQCSVAQGGPATSTVDPDTKEFK